MRLRLALLGVAALVPLLLAEVQEHEALRFCSDKEASKHDLFKSYWRKCSTECRLAPARARAEKMMAARERARKKASLLNDDDDEPEWARDDYFDD